MGKAERNNRDAQARTLAQVLLAQPDTAACIVCLDTIEAYVAAQLAGEEYAARWVAVAQHLDSCVACAESYARVYEARLAESEAPAPARIPAPDLSFLPGAAARGAPGLLRAALAAAVERAGAHLRLTLSQALLDLLPPSSPALALRSGMADTPLFALDLDEPGSEVEQLRLSAYADSHAAERCSVRVQLSLRGREWPDLAGIPVALILGADRRPAATDSWGEAVFGDVPAEALPGLVVEVDASG
jgi:hypothetical protein